jgi:nucleotide-binding universal stress UspA family protein
MSSPHGSIVVGIDGTLGSDTAQRWAIDEARASHRPLRLICTYGWDLNYAQVPMYSGVLCAEDTERKHSAEQTVKTALDQVRGIAEDVEATADAIEGATAEILMQEASEASVIVLGSRQLNAAKSFLLGSVGAAVAARAECPVVVTRGPNGYAQEGARVIVGVDASPQSDAVLAFAFDQASRHNVGLRAVLCWTPSVLSASRWVNSSADRAHVRAGLWLSEALAGWREKYPDVNVTSVVVEDHPVSALVLASTAQYLLVVGKRGRHAVTGTLLGSVSQGVLHHATCPVAVVPTTTDVEPSA